MVLRGVVDRAGVISNSISASAAPIENGGPEIIQDVARRIPSIRDEYGAVVRIVSASAALDVSLPYDQNYAIPPHGSRGTICAPDNQDAVAGDVARK